MLNQSNMSAEDYYNSGTVYAFRGDFEKAIADYDKAINLNPNFVDAYYNRGLIYEDRGLGNILSGRDYFEKAIADYDKAIDINPNFAKAYNNRGIAYYNLGLIAYALPNILSGRDYFEKAIADYDKAIELRHGDPKVYFNRSLILLKGKDWEEAEADLIAARDRGFDIVHAFFISCGNNERDVERASAKFRPDIIRMLRGQ